MLAEKQKAEKIKTCATSEIKQKIMLLVDNFTNKQLWLELYKKEVTGKMK